MSDLAKKAAQAYTRKSRDPIYITNQLSRPTYDAPLTTEVRGSFNPESSEIAIKKPGFSVDPQEILDVLKHELVHKILLNATLPTNQEVKNTFNYQSPTPGFFNNMFVDPSAQPGPSNMYRWADYQRSGDPQQELPAYMAIYNPKELTDPVNKQTPSVMPNQRDQYMKDLIAYLIKTGQQDRVNLLAHLIEGRTAYNGTGLLPTQNVGDRMVSQ